MSYKLFIPGPVEVSEKTYKAMATPIMGHRSKDFVKLVEVSNSSSTPKTRFSSARAPLGA
mgnify:CR=1 FL=1